MISHSRSVSPRLVRVAAYCRVSMESERTRKSLSTQVSYYNKLIGSTPGWVFAGIYADCGISGRRTENRPEFMRLLEAARTGQVDVILTKSISRFARNTVDLLRIVRELKGLGVEVRFEKENISSFTADGELLLTLLASFAQAESEQISQNVSWRVQRGFQQGKANGFHLYGYTDSKDASDVEIIEHEAEVVRLVYANYLAGISCEETARQLHTRGVVNRKGEAFGPEVLRSWLKMETFTGTLTLGRWINPGFGQHSRLNKGEADMYQVEDAIPAIIPKETFQAVQDELARRRTLGARANKAIPTSTFTHMIYCPACAKYYRTRVVKAYNGTKRRKWVCATNRENGHGCDSKRIPQESLENIICQALDLEVFDEEVFLARIERIDILDANTAVVIHKNGDTSTHQITYPNYRKDYWDTPGARERQGRKQRAYWGRLSSEEYEAECAKRAAYRQAEAIEKQKARAQKIKDSWTPERRARQSQIAKRTNAKLGAEGRKERARKANETIRNNPQVAERKRQAMLQHWQDPAYREKTIAAMKAGQAKKKEGLK